MDIEHARAVVATGLLLTTDVDINQYHRTTAHTHPRLLRESARQQGVKLKPGVKLLPCAGCSTAKGFSAPVKKPNADQIGNTEESLLISRARSRYWLWLESSTV